MVLGRHITDAKAGKPSREQFLCLWDTESLERAVSMDSCMLVIAVSVLHTGVLQLWLALQAWETLLNTLAWLGAEIQLQSDLRWDDYWCFKERFVMTRLVFVFFFFSLRCSPFILFLSIPSCFFLMVHSVGHLWSEALTFSSFVALCYTSDSSKCEISQNMELWRFSWQVLTVSGTCSLSPKDREELLLYAVWNEELCRVPILGCSFQYFPGIPALAAMSESAVMSYFTLRF